MLSKETTNISHRYYITNCACLSDLEIAVEVVREAGGKIVNKHWDRKLGGVAYISFDVSKDKELCVIEFLGRDNCY